MNTTAAAVIVIIIAALILAVMAGIGGYVLGRTFATDAAKKTDERLHRTLVGLKDDTLVVSKLLLFTQDRAFDYRRIAEQSVAHLPDGTRKNVLMRELQATDKKMMAKVVKIEDYRKESSKKG